MRSTLGKALVVFLAFGLLAAACSRKSTPSSQKSSSAVVQTPTGPASSPAGATVTIDGESANNKGTKDLTGTTSAEVEADTDGGISYFDPTILTGSPGEKVTIELKNNSSKVKHNFTLADQNVNVDLAPGKSARVSVTFPQSGTLEFHCEYHQSVGMVGGLQTV